jgi:hypothetical protein
MSIRLYAGLVKLALHNLCKYVWLLAILEESVVISREAVPFALLVESIHPASHILHETLRVNFLGQKQVLLRRITAKIVP